MNIIKGDKTMEFKHSESGSMKKTILRAYSMNFNVSI